MCRIYRRLLLCCNFRSDFDAKHLLDNELSFRRGSFDAKSLKADQECEFALDARCVRQRSTGPTGPRLSAFLL